tara:strand:+ start:259 stop:600 length:342 start_codon:yes stop_codon:yes gene_type:complete
LKITIYHNPSCSKSRAVLSILNKKQVEFDLIDYLKTPPTKVALQKILFKIGGNASDLLRTNEKEYKILGLENATDEQILHAITNYPVLLQRPIVITANNAIIARPPEKALEIL